LKACLKLISNLKDLVPNKDRTKALENSLVQFTFLSQPLKEEAQSN